MNVILNYIFTYLFFISDVTVITDRELCIPQRIPEFSLTRIQKIITDRSSGFRVSIIRANIFTHINADIIRSERSSGVW